jgi:hypothetical protein
VPLSLGPSSYSDGVAISVRVERLGRNAWTIRPRLEKLKVSGIRYSIWCATTVASAAAAANLRLDSQRSMTPAFLQQRVETSHEVIQFTDALLECLWDRRTQRASSVVISCPAQAPPRSRWTRREQAKCLGNFSELLQSRP